MKGARSKDTGPGMPAPPRVDPALSEAYAYERDKRSSWDGIAQAAIAGDRECLVDLAGFATVILDDVWKRHPNMNFHDAAFWLSSVMADIQGGMSPNEAFGWEQPGKLGRRPSFEALRRQWMISQWMRSLIENIKGVGRNAAEAHLCEVFALTPAEAAWHCSENGVTSVGTVGATRAREIAADVVAKKFEVKRDLALLALKKGKK